MATIRPRRRKQPPSQPLDWARHYLPHYLSDPPCDLHAAIMEALSDDAHRSVAIVAPRGHGKSVISALAFPLWCICLKHRRNIVIVTHERSLATQFVQDIRTELTENPELTGQYSNLLEGCKGGQARFTTTSGVTVQAKSTGASFRGLRVGPNRPDLVICDDLEKDGHVASAEGRRKLDHWLRRVVIPALAPRGRIVVLGSLIHYDSLLANLRDPRRFPRWKYLVYRAKEGKLRPDGSFVMVPCWPARWPLAKLEEERQRIGSTAFEQEYMANPVDEETRVFKPEWLRRYEPSELNEQRLTTFIAVDPATGASSGDFFAMWVGSVDTASGIIYTRELTLERIGIVEQIDRIISAFQRWRPVTVGIETNAYQIALKQSIEEKSRRLKLYIPVVSIANRKDKKARVQGSAPFYENGLFSTLR